MSHSPSARAGFTIIEVMVAMAVLTVGLATGFGAMTTAHQTAERSRLRDIALNDLQSTLENMAATAYMNIDGYATDKTRSEVTPSGLAAPTGRAAVRLITFDPVYDNDGNGQRALRIHYQWIDQTGIGQIETTYIHATRFSGTTP